MNKQEIIGRLLVVGGLLGAGVKTANAVRDFENEQYIDGSKLYGALIDEAGGLQNECTGSGDVATCIEYLPGKSGAETLKILDAFTARVDQAIPGYKQAVDQTNEDVLGAFTSILASLGGVVLTTNGKPRTPKKVK